MEKEKEEKEEEEKKEEEEEKRDSPFGKGKGWVRASAAAFNTLFYFFIFFTDSSLSRGVSLH